jgi:hypothetical protein
VNKGGFLKFVDNCDVLTMEGEIVVDRIIENL